jgi:hypothetical protein
MTPESARMRRGLSDLRLGVAAYRKRNSATRGVRPTLRDLDEHLLILGGLIHRMLAPVH